MSDSVTPRTVAHQASLSVEFPRQEYWSGLPFPPPGNLPDPGIEPWSPELQADSLPSKPPGNSNKINSILLLVNIIIYEIIIIIALPGKEGHSSLLLPKTLCPNPVESGEEFYGKVQGGVADKIRVCAGPALL